MSEAEPGTPFEQLGVLASQEVAVTAALQHLELFTARGLLTVLWHGEPGFDRAVIACGGAMGGLLGPADGLFHDLGVALAAQGIATLRLSYRRPNDLGACVLDAAAVAEMASRQGARRFVVVGHSFGGAVAVQLAVALPDVINGVVTLSTQSAGCEHADGLNGRPFLMFHGDRDEILPVQASEMVRLIAGTGELVVLEGAGHLLSQAGAALRSRLIEWIPRVLETGAA